MRSSSHWRVPYRLLALLATGVVALDAVAESRWHMEEPESRHTVIFDFDPATEPWANIDDPVMGGRSRSRMTLGDHGAATFEGVVSLENNGGFASLRSRPTDFDLEGFNGIVLRLRGDGQTYGVRLRTSSQFDGVSYQAKVATEAGRWAEVKIPFEVFRAVFRGRQVPDYPALDPGEIKTFGLMIADRQEGAFRLEIDWIKAYRERSQAGLR